MSIRQFLVPTIALAILPIAVLRAADTAEYVGGTVKSIPMNSTGFIEFSDTKVLIFETPISNDRAKGLSDTEQNRAAILAFAKAHGLTAISLSPLLPGIAGAEHRDPDGQHFDAVGHFNIAKSLAPRVRKAVGCR